MVFGLPGIDSRDNAMALECYAQQALNMEAERQAAEIRIRAERKAGELLKESKNIKPTRRVLEVRF